MKIAPGWKLPSSLAPGCFRNCRKESEIAVLDTRLGAAAAFQVDRGAAQDRIARLETVANSQPLPRILEEALRLVEQNELPRKEVYVFTDLAQAAWPPDAAEQAPAAPGANRPAWACT